MCPALYKISIKKVATPLLGVAFLFGSYNTILAGEVKQCTVGEDCTIGEFVYNDSYSPETGATCTLDSKYPDGTDYLTAQSLTGSSDGWYGYTFTSPSTNGFYRSQVCCDIGTEHMCIDKSFEVKDAATNLNTTDIASAVWGYSGRTLTGFNNLVADVWSYASRSLTSGANISSSVSSTDIEKIKKNTTETRLLLEGLVNKPIIENSFEEVKDLDLGDRINQSKTVSNELNINLLFLGSSVDKMNKNWSSLSDRQLLDSLNEVKNLLGDESDSSSVDSIFGRVNFVRDTWKLKEGDDLHEELKAIKESVGFVQTGVASYGKSKTLQKELLSINSYFKSSEKYLALINKKIQDAESTSSLIDNNLSSLNSILGSWNQSDYLSLKDKVEDLAKSVLALNKLPKGQVAIDSVYPDITGEKKLKNKVLGLRALLLANKKLMFSGEKLAFAANWLEEGSIVIKTLVTNPSNLISQEVPLKYYLPKELKKEDILDVDSGAEVKYDTDKDQLFVEASFNLKPGESRTIKVRVEDVWVISESEIDSLKKQAEDLVKTLEKTSFYAQGITLKSDIDVSLEKVRSLSKDSLTPESKIKSFREANLELVSVQEKIEKLKEIVSQANNSGSILGFVGGSQAIAVWGIVLAVVASFVFMTIYLKKLLRPETATVKMAVKTQKPNTFDKMAVFLVIATISALSSSIAVKKFVLPVQAKVNTSTAAESNSVLGTSTIDYKSLRVVNLVSSDGVVKTYQTENGGAVLEIVDSGKSAIEIERKNDMVKVVIDQKEVWVSKDSVN